MAFKTVTVKDLIEKAIREKALTFHYGVEPELDEDDKLLNPMFDSIQIGHEEKPKGVKNLIVNLIDPYNNLEKGFRGQPVLIDGMGELVIVITKDIKKEDIDPDSYKDYAAAFITQYILDEPRINEDLKGSLKPASWKQGIMELEKTKAFFYVGRVVFEFEKATWQPPTIEEV